MDVDNVSIELTLDNNLELTMCSYPYVSIGNNKFKIQVGQVKITEYNSFLSGLKHHVILGYWTRQLARSQFKSIRILPSDLCGPVQT